MLKIAAVVRALCCLFKRILWMARMLHEASEAISLFSNPSFSNALIKICCAASSCGARIVADTKALTLAGLEKEEERMQGVTGGQMAYFGQGRGSGAFEVQLGTATSVWKWIPLKIIN